jgi:hypothetical protein
MRTPLFVVAFSFSCAACGTSSKDGGSTANGSASTVAFNPPPAAEGYTRIVSPTVHGVGPGDDVTYCQYLMAPFDHDVDVLDVEGYQSAFGHHAVAFTYTPKDGEEIGTTFPCMGTEFSSGADGGASPGDSLSMGTFLGGIGGADGRKSATSLPEGVAFRLQRGQGVMLNVHYLNTGEKTVDGNAVVDIEFAEPDPARKIAAIFVNLDSGFSLSPASPTTSAVDCVAQSDVQIIMMTNHMHEYGTSASTEVQRAGANSFESLHDDPNWTYDMQFNPVYTRWSVDAPFVLHAGDTLRTTCNWDNPTSNTIAFPREMCVGVGFALATGADPTAPLCANGTWLGPKP